MTPRGADRSHRRAIGVVVAPVPTALGVHLLRGVRLVDHAVRALVETSGCDVVVVDAEPAAPGGAAAHASDEVRTVRPGLPLSRLAAGYDVVLVHDPLCPLVPARALSACLDAVGPDGAVVGVLPVTDTVKRVEADVIISTVDRDSLRLLAAPVAFAASLVPALGRLLPRAHDLHDLVRLVGVLGDLATVVPVQVPARGRRVDDAEDVAVLECLGGHAQALPDA